MRFCVYLRISMLLILLLAVAAPAHAGKGLVADYAFRSSGGGDTTLRDESGRENHGAIHGATWRRGEKAFRLVFDGENDYVDCGAGASLDLRKAATVEVWVKPETDPLVEVGIAGKHFSNYALTLYRGAYWWYISSGSNQVKSAARIGAWQHVVGTFDGQDMKLYVDGKLATARKSKLPVSYTHLTLPTN